MPRTVSFDSLNQALERALRYRRQLAVDSGHPPGNLDELITGVAFAPDAVRSDGRPGWLHIGRVFDTVIGEMLEVYWQPATDRVQIDRPKDWTPIPSPTIAHAPLVWVHGMGFWATDATYRYFHAGCAYTAREAEARINAAKSPEGWTWEAIGNGEVQRLLWTLHGDGEQAMEHQASEGHEMQAGDPSGCRALPRIGCLGRRLKTKVSILGGACIY